jgi:5-methylcytosine-specific restriction endonuclease McrA
VEASEARAQLEAVADRLSAFAGRLEDRDELDELVAEIRHVQAAYFGPRPPAARGAGAKWKLLDYMKQRVGQTVYGDELHAISGIHEWPRRVRELRVEHGYDITELGRSRYRLEQHEPDEERARSWRVLNTIKGSGGSARDRIGRLLEARVGEVVTREEIDYVAGIREGIRRLRELRDESGWPIDSYIDDPSLRPSEYRLLSTDPADRRDPLQRLYPDEVRQMVFERDNYTCQVCGRNREAALAAGDTRFYLELHHRVAVADEVAELPKEERNDPANLVTLCHSDHLRETAELQRRRRTERRRG